MRTSWVILLILVVPFIQSSLFDMFAYQGVRPDFILILVVYFALFEGVPRATMIGLITGFIQDALLGGPLGLYLLTKTILGYTLANMGKKIVSANLMVQMIVVVTGTLLEGVIVGGIFSFFKLRLLELSSWGYLIFLQAVYNGAVSLAFIPLLSWLGRRDLKRKKNYPGRSGRSRYDRAM